MKREAAKVQAKANGRPCTDTWLCTNAKLIVEHLTEAVWDDGKPRVTSTLTVFVEDGCLKVSLNDRDQCRSLYASAESVQGAIKAIEEALATGATDWRAWRTGGKKK